MGLKTGVKNRVAGVLLTKVCASFIAVFKSCAQKTAVLWQDVKDASDLTLGKILKVEQYTVSTK